MVEKRSGDREVFHPRPRVKNFTVPASLFYHPISILNKGGVLPAVMPEVPAGTTMRRSDHDVSDSIRTTDPAAVGGEVVRIYKALYGKARAIRLERAFDDID